MGPESATMLNEEEVRSRLGECKNPEIIDELYTFGQALAKESLHNVQITESKATSLAAYGTAIVTLLVSSAFMWSRLGNQWTLWIAASAGLCGLLCTVFSVRAMSLKEYQCISEDEWLKQECLSGNVAFLKGFRILTLWGTIDSNTKAQANKVYQLWRAQMWLKVSVAYLFIALLHIAFLRSTGDRL
jgi:hypothetical protein